jgi:hypothetical protein
MRPLLLFFIVLLTSITTNAQTIEGIYSNKWESPSGEAIAYNLILNSDGTFKFQSTKTYMDAIPNKTIEAEGTWDLDGHLLVLTTSEHSNELASDLDMNKARYVTVSPRNRKFNLANPSLKFYKSKVFYAKDMELFKTESCITTSN